MTFKEILVGDFALRFWPSDNGWMCGITPSMMEALERQASVRREWVGLTDEERDEICLGDESIARAIEAKLKEKNK